MKLLKYILAFTVGVLLFTACDDLNKAPEFDDADAFVAFRSSTVSIGEEKGTIDIPVLLTSLSGLATTVDFEFVTEGSTALEGKNFTVLNSSKKLTFTKDAPIQYIKLSLVDNATFDGDVKVSIKLSSPVGVNLGDSKLLTLTLTDNEHPLLFILGELTAKGTSYYNGAEEWKVTIAKDPTDLTKVWITNFVNGGSSPTTPIYGVVNAEKTEIKIPVAQIVATSTSYPKILLEGFYGPDGAEGIPTGGSITGEIAADGTITILDEFGSHVYSDAAATVSLGWYNVFQSGTVLKK